MMVTKFQQFLMATNEASDNSTDDMKKFIPEYEPNAERDDAANAEILKSRMAEFNAEKGARVGDFLLLPNGKYDRFTHAWDDHIQTGGYGNGSYYFGGKWVSYSGGLDPGVKYKDIEQTEATKDGAVWFFSKNHARAFNAVYYHIPFRVFKLREGADTKGLWTLDKH